MSLYTNFAAVNEHAAGPRSGLSSTTSNPTISFCLLIPSIIPVNCDQDIPPGSGVPTAGIKEGSRQSKSTLIYTFGEEMAATISWWDGG